MCPPPHPNPGRAPEDPALCPPPWSLPHPLSAQGDSLPGSSDSEEGRAPLRSSDPPAADEDGGAWRLSAVTAAAAGSPGLGFGGFVPAGGGRAQSPARIPACRPFVQPAPSAPCRPGAAGPWGSGCLLQTLQEHPHFPRALALSRGALPPLCLPHRGAPSGPCWGLVLVAHESLSRARGRDREGGWRATLWLRGLWRKGPRPTRRVSSGGFGARLRAPALLPPPGGGGGCAPRCVPGARPVTPVSCRSFVCGGRSEQRSPRSPPGSARRGGTGCRRHVTSPSPVCVQTPRRPHPRPVPPPPTAPSVPPDSGSACFLDGLLNLQTRSDEYS